ncbi:uncharacterized protein LOC127123874 [Lathyrus oleraceus]|uniref:uncharacterized protein LOC127123874 n=1 Tax=Pisum sativum TaxID=3888 RepID=UPI0021CE4ED3|nr:uncharacterized protein LOC127123874 [Pisum sativum]
MDRNILDAASGGALVDKTPVAAKALIENMSLNSQQFTTRSNSMVQTKCVNDIQVSSSNKALETKIEELTSLVKQMAVSKPQTTKLCGICTSTEHPTDTCPILQDDSVTQLPQAYAANFFNQSNNQRGYSIPDLSTNKYHPNWRNHPNLRYGNQQLIQQQLVIPLPQPQTTPQVSTSAPSRSSLEDLVKQMAVNNLQYSGFADTDWTACHFDECHAASPRIKPTSCPNKTEPSVVVETEKEKEKEYMPPVPFPHRILKNKRTGDGDKEREILDVFRKVAVNIPLLDVIKQVPKYAKFLKDLCTSKKRLKGNERVNLGRNISALIQPKHSPEKANVSSLNQAIPQKCKDPRTFVIPCAIGDSKFDNCMLDLGAGINVMPTSVYNNLDLGLLQHTCLIIQLANKSNARPIGVVEDVLVQPVSQNANPEIISSLV